MAGVRECSDVFGPDWIMSDAAIALPSLRSTRIYRSLVCDSVAGPFPRLGVLKLITANRADTFPPLSPLDFPDTGQLLRLTRAHQMKY